MPCPEVMASRRGNDLSKPSLAPFSPSEFIDSSDRRLLPERERERAWRDRLPFLEWRVQLLRKCLSHHPPSFGDERRIASSQSGDRERDPKNAGKTGLPSRSAQNEKAIRENIQTLDGGGDRDVVITGERGGGGNAIQTRSPLAMMSSRSTKGVSPAPLRGNGGLPLLSGSSTLTLLTR